MNCIAALRAQEQEKKKSEEFLENWEVSLVDCEWDWKVACYVEKFWMEFA